MGRHARSDWCPVSPGVVALRRIMLGQPVLYGMTHAVRAIEEAR